MSEWVTWFEPQPSLCALPLRLPSPFAAPPHSLARRAADELLVRLRRGELPDGVSPGFHDQPGRGQMFGVLVVVNAAGRVGYLRAFSGMLEKRWQVSGFAPPLFDPVARDAIWVAGQEDLNLFAARHRELPAGPERRRLERQRKNRSRQLLTLLYDGYLVPNARRQHSALWPLFAPSAPPGGAGDCAAPKLFALAYREALRPLALAELWWGAASLDGAHHPGVYYPACQGKCGALLSYMLDGSDVEPSPHSSPAIALEEPRVVYQDAWLMVVDKPCGLASLPGRHEPGRDSVRTRLHERHPASSPIRLSAPLETESSGLMLAARDPASHSALNRQLALGHAERRFVALLEGSVVGQGAVDVRLRGKRAITDWRALASGAGRTRVLLWPRTAHANQLRQHTAHVRGIGAHIVGDPLYGYGAAEPRLLLHSEALAFNHPVTGVRLELERHAPF